MSGITGFGNLAVQVGIRDYCEQENEFIHALGKRATVFFDRELTARRFAGESWAKTCQEIVAALPEVEIERPHAT